MSPHLEEIPAEQWKELRDLYVGKQCEPASYNTLQNYIQWQAANPELNAKIYALDGDWREDGTFVLDDNTTVMCNTLSENTARLVAALKCLDKKEFYFFTGIPDRLSDAIGQHFENIGLRDAYKPAGTFWVHLPRQVVNSFTIEPPEGFTAGNLDLTHAEQINRVWPHRTPGSVEFIKTLIQYNLNAGAFDGSNKLVAWCLTLPIGSLGVLQVEESHKRMGLGSLVVRCLAKKIAAEGLEVLAPVVFENTASRCMFEKLGAQIIDNAWFVPKPAQTD